MIEEQFNWKYEHLLGKSYLCYQQNGIESDALALQLAQQRKAGWTPLDSDALGQRVRHELASIPAQQPDLRDLHAVVKSGAMPSIREEDSKEKLAGTPLVKMTHIRTKAVTLCFSEDEHRAWQGAHADERHDYHVKYFKGPGTMSATDKQQVTALKATAPAPAAC
jgi:hypothetical protein